MSYDIYIGTQYHEDESLERSLIGNDTNTDSIKWPHQLNWDDLRALGRLEGDWLYTHDTVEVTREVLSNFMVSLDKLHTTVIKWQEYIDPQHHIYKSDTPDTLGDFVEFLKNRLELPGDIFYIQAW